MEARGGGALTDWHGFYFLGAGPRYDLKPRVSLTVAAIDQHLSKAYQTNPIYGFDSIGLSFGAN